MLKLTYVCLVVFMIIMFAVTAINAWGQAPDPPKHVVEVTATYNRADFNIKNFNGEVRSVDADRDSPGFNVSYDYYPTSSPLTVGMSTGASFENRANNEVYSCGPNCVATNGGTSKVAKAYFQYQMGLAKRTGVFQPGVAGVIGVDRGDFGGVTFTGNNLVRIGGGSRFFYGAQGHVDIKLAKHAFWRTGVKVTNAFNTDVSQLDVQAKTGLAFKW